MSIIEKKEKNLNQLISKLNSLTSTYSQPIYELENYRTKLIEYIDRLIYHLVNKERTSGEDISLQHLRILREMPQIEEIEFDNSRGSNVQKTQYSLLSEEHLKSFLDSTKNYNKKDNNHNWKTDKNLNPNLKFIIYLHF